MAKGEKASRTCPVEAAAARVRVGWISAAYLFSGRSKAKVRQTLLHTGRPRTRIDVQLGDQTPAQNEADGEKFDKDDDDIFADVATSGASRIEERENLLRENSKTPDQRTRTGSMSGFEQRTKWQNAVAVPPTSQILRRPTRSM